jgi:hypothetical protein
MRLGGSDSDYVSDIATLPDGSILIAGPFFDEMTYDEKSPNRGETIPAGAFVICINANGSVHWTLHAGGTGDVEGWVLDVFSDTHFYVFGRYWGTVIFGPGESTETELTDGGSYIAKYSLEGNLVWARRIGNLPVQFLAEEAISVADDGSFTIAGGYGNEVTFGQGEANETTLTRYGGFDIFVARYNSSGEFIWATKAGGENPGADMMEGDLGTDVVVSPDGSSLVTGCFFSSAIFGEGELNETTLFPKSTHDDDIFLAKYYQDGSLAWVKSLGAGVDFFRAMGGWPKMTIGSGGAIYITSSFADTAKFGDGDPPEDILSSPGIQSAFVAKYESDGSFVWVTKVGGDTISMDISMMSDDALLITGTYQDSTTFGSGEPNETTFLIEDIYDMGDVFVAKYDNFGGLVWARRAIGEDMGRGVGIVKTIDETAVLVGHFQNDLWFCKAGGGETELKADGYDTFIVKLSEGYIEK